MSIGLGAWGAWAQATTGTISPAHPSGITAGQLLVLCLLGRYSNHIPTTPAGWTLRTDTTAVVAGGGAGTNALDTGTSKAVLYTKIADGSETGTLAVTVSGNNHQAIIGRFTRGGTGWDVAGSVGGDTTLDTTYSVTGNAALSFAVGDWLLSTSVIASDTPTFSAKAHSAAGVTFDAGTTDVADSPSTLGSNQRAGIFRTAVTAGAATIAPVRTMTLSVADAGSTALLRIRQVGSDFVPNPLDGRGLKYHMNRKAGTLNASDLPTLEAQGAANVWAGTTALDLVGALNAKAGTVGLDLVGVLNRLAGTTTLEQDGAAASIP